MTGTLEALYWMISGGVAPGGMTRRIVWDTAVTWARAASTFTFGWK
jgi:hypothetical protein